MTGDALTARLAITDQIHRYCRAVDRLDVALGHGVFHADSYADFGSYRGDGRGWIDFICERHRDFLHHSHQVTNILIALSGDRAGSESYVTATLWRHAGAVVAQQQFFARYVDAWSRRDGHWAIDARECVIDFASETVVDPLQTGGRARRDRYDPSYAILRPRHDDQADERERWR